MELAVCLNPKSSKKMEAQRDEERKKWLTLKWKKCLNTSYNNHGGSHVTTDPRLSQGVSKDHAMEHVPGLVLQQPLIRTRSYKASVSGARWQSVPSDHPECTSGYQLWVVFIFQLWHCSLCTQTPSADRVFFLWASFVFFLPQLCQVTRFCFTFVLCLLIIWPKFCFCFYLKPCFDRH